MSQKRELFDCSLRGVANRVAYQLGDLDDAGHSKGRYSDQYLCAAVADAIRVLAELRKEDFVDQIRFEVGSGDCVQTLPEECDSFLEFLCFEDTDTKEQYPVFSGESFTDIRKLNYVPGPANNCSLSMLTQFKTAFSPNSTRVFALSPAIPEGRNFEAIALCSVVGDIVSDQNADLPSVVKPLIPALVSLTSYMMLLADIGDPTALAQAQSHLSTVTTILQITSARIAAAQAAAEAAA